MSGRMCQSLEISGKTGVEKSVKLPWPLPATASLLPLDHLRCLRWRPSLWHNQGTQLSWYKKIFLKSLLKKKKKKE